MTTASAIAGQFRVIIEEIKIEIRFRVIPVRFARHAVARVFGTSGSTEAGMFVLSTARILMVKSGWYFGVSWLVTT